MHTMDAAAESMAALAALNPATVTRRDSRSGRFYTVEGDPDPYVSVTHALTVISKPALVAWAAKEERTMVADVAADVYAELTVAKTPPISRPTFLATLMQRVGTQKAHQKQLAKAAEIGSQVHHLIEWNLRTALGQSPGPEPAVALEGRHAFASYQAWADSVQLRPIFIEQMVYSRTRKYAGTMDLLAEVDGRRMVIDFKTGKRIYSEAFLQNVAYQVALTEMGFPAPEGGLVVRLPKTSADPDFEVAEVPPVTELWPVWEHVLGLWAWWYAQDASWRATQKEGA